MPKHISRICSKKMKSKRVFRDGDIVQMDDFGVCFHLDSEECIANCGQINPIDNPLVGLSCSRIKEMKENLKNKFEDRHAYSHFDIYKAIDEVFEGVE